MRLPLAAAVSLALLLALAGCGRDQDAARSGAADGTDAAGNAAANDGANAGDGEANAGPTTPATWPRMPEGAAPRIDMGKALVANYYVVLDGSGSMMESECSGRQLKMEVAQRAVQQFIASIPEQANVGLAVFDAHGLSERVPLGIGNRPKLRRAIGDISADESTPLRSAVTLAYQKLEAQGISQSGYGEYHLVIVTDGQPEPYDEDPRPIVDQVLQESPVVIHTIGFCLGEDHALNQPGRTLYAAADSPAELQQGLSAVLAEAPSFDASSFRD